LNSDTVQHYGAAGSSAPIRVPGDRHAVAFIAVPRPSAKVMIKKINGVVAPMSAKAPQAQQHGARDLNLLWKKQTWCVNGVARGSAT